MPSSTTSKHHSSTSSNSPTSSSSPNGNSASGGGLGKTTTIIIAVVASVAGIVLILIIYRYIRHRINRSRAAPLPPVQPIAHHREQQLAQFEERKFGSSSPLGNVTGSGSTRNSSVWAQQQQLHQQHLMAPGPTSTSDVSLTQSRDRSRSASPSPNMSLLNQHEMMAALDVEKPLPHPSPAFHGTGTGSGSVRDSSSSIGSLAERASTPTSPFPFPETPTSAQSHMSTQPLAPSTSSTRQIRPRPSSMVSTTSRKSFVGTIRGAPHGPHSTVQIVLPTPLAPGLSPYGHGDGGWLRGDGVGGGGGGKRDSGISVVDKWAGVPVERSGSEEGSLGGLVAPAHADARDSISTSRSSSSQSPLTPQRHPLHQLHSQSHPRSLQPRNNSPSSPRNSRHVSGGVGGSSMLNPAQSSPSAPPTSFRDHSLTPPPPTPPVPRIPSGYNQFSHTAPAPTLIASGTNANSIRLDDDDEEEGGERRRGRGRPVSLSIEHSGLAQQLPTPAGGRPRTRN